MALNINTSIADNNGVALNWSNSALEVSSILALNEVINRPEDFTSFTPHLVVQHDSWVYLNNDIRCKQNIFLSRLPWM